MPDDGAKQPAPVKPMLEGYAVSDIAHVKDRKKDKKVCTYLSNVHLDYFFIEIFVL